MKLKNLIFSTFLVFCTIIKADLNSELGKFKNSLLTLSSQLGTSEFMTTKPPKTEKKESLEKLSYSMDIIKNKQKINNLDIFITDLQSYINFLIQNKQKTILVNDFSNEQVKKFFEAILDATDFHPLMQDLGLEKSEWEETTEFVSWDQIKQRFNHVFEYMNNPENDIKSKLPKEYKD